MNSSQIEESSRRLKLDTPLDVMAIYVLPLLCFAVDFAIGGLATTFYPATIWAFAISGMIAFAYSKCSESPETIAIARGVLKACGVGSLIIGVMMLPISMLAIQITGIGLLGFVPFLTGYRILHQAHKLKSASGKSWIFEILGLITVFVVVMGILFIEISGDQRRYEDLLSGNLERNLRALSPTAWYGPRDVIGHPEKLSFKVCTRLEEFPLQDEGIRAAIERILKISAGDSIEQKCEFILND